MKLTVFHVQRFNICEPAKPLAFIRAFGHSKKRATEVAHSFRWQAFRVWLAFVRGDCVSLAEFEHHHSTALRHCSFGVVQCVDARLHALCINAPTGLNRNVLFTVDFKG
jgi:hypothetical protein